MTLLIISPDYASHLLPLATIGTAWRAAGHRLVVATGPSTASIVEAFGFERVDLRLGKGSNPGVIRPEDQPKGEDDALRGFFDATRLGMLETLAFQAEARLSDLMWEPVRVAREVQAVVDSVDADAIVVDHLAFSARLALTARHTPFADVVLGHPSALPLGDELYGFPLDWPTAFEPDAARLERLRDLCARVSESFTREWNTALAELAPDATPSANAFAEHGDLLLYNYPEALVPAARRAELPPHAFLGSAVRTEPVDPEIETWLAASTDPFVYVSFGSFLSVRDDVLARVAAAIRSLGLRAAIAVGSGDREVLGELPAGWLVREFLPQVRLLSAAAVTVTHGGNNSVTEAVSAGVPMLVLPYSTDQFAGAAAIERAGLGLALAPNTAGVDELTEAVGRLLTGPFGGRSARLAGELAQASGPELAFAAITGAATARVTS